MKNSAPPDDREKRWREVCRFDDREMTCCTLTLARQYVADFPHHSYAWVVYAEALCSVARYQEAIAAFKQALRRCPPKRLDIVQALLGILYKQKGQFRLAEKWFRRSIDSRPDDATSYIYLGGMIASEGRLKDAEAIHRQATLCKEGCIDEAYLNLGLVLRAQEHYPEAIACFQLAIELDPKYKDAKRELKDVKRVMDLEHKSAK